MTRPITTMKPELFEKIVDQLTPLSAIDWVNWQRFVQFKYGIHQFEMSENHFFLYVLSRVVQLHGHGEPVLDKNICSYIKMLSDRGLSSYLSCNPANIDIPQTVVMFRNGLGYIKYSIESLDNKEQERIRGQKARFDVSKILEVLDMKRKFKAKTVVVITMIDLNRETQQEDYAELKRLFYGEDVYIYLKSENTQWYRKDIHENKSIHWSEPCKHPWMSMSISSDGQATTCPSDYNNEIVFGDTNTESLESIWNGKLYEKFREDHMNVTKGIRCTDHCDMKLMGESC